MAYTKCIQLKKVCQLYSPKVFKSFCSQSTESNIECSFIAIAHRYNIDRTVLQFSVRHGKPFVSINMPSYVLLINR